MLSTIPVTDLVVQIDSHEDAKRLAMVLDAQGYVWHSGGSLPHPSLFEVKRGWRLCADHTVLHGSLEEYHENGNPILTVAEYLAQFTEPEADVTADLTALL